MFTLQKVQNAAVDNFSSQSDNYAFDPATIMVIIEMVMKFIESLQNCRNPVNAAKVVNNPTRLQKRVVRWQVRRALGRQSYKEYGDKLVKALLDTGKNITADEMAQMYDELG